MSSKIKYQTRNCSIASGTVAGSKKEFDVTLESEYDKCTGVALYRSKDGGISFYRVGLKDDNQVFQEVTHVADWESSTSVPITERYKPETIRAAGRTVSIVVQIPEDTTDTLEFDFVFRLEKSC